MTSPAVQPLAVLKKHGRSFYFASHLLGAKHTIQAARLYSFCRHVDDLVDEAENPQLACLHISQVKHAISAGHSADARVQDMLALMQELHIPNAPVFSLIEGMEYDLLPRHVQDEAELLNYAYKVAGTVGLMMCKVLDVQDAMALPFAIDLGIAMQLTNIARDVAEDAARGRVYLPADWVNNLSAVQIQGANIQQTAVLKHATEKILALAENYYQSGLSGLGYLPPAARCGILVAAMVYRDIGKKVLELGAESLTQRAVVPGYRKLACAMVALIKSLFSPGFFRLNKRHHQQLHQYLYNCYGSSTHEYRE